MNDPVYFLDTFGWTFDPRPEAYPHHMPFKLYDYQKELLLDVIKHITEGRGLMVEKSRDMGASWVILGAILWCWLFMPGFQALLGSRTEDMVDNNTLESLLPKITYMLDRLPFKPEGFDPLKHKTRMKLINPMNGNTISGQSASPNFGRQGRYRVVLLDEMAFWEAPQSSWASCGESTRCRIAITTPPEKPNFAKYLRFSGLIDVKTLHWRQHPLKDDTWYALMKTEKTSEELAREVDINWEGAITGRMYPEVSHVRIGDFPYRPDWPLYISHDPGHDPDPHALGWFQVDPENGRKRLVESTEVYKKIAPWFLPLFGKPIQSGFAYTPEELELITKVGLFKGAIHVGDQYGRTRNQVTGTSVYEEWQKEQIYVNVNTKEVDFDSRKAAARKVLMEMDINDTVGNRHFIECIKESRYPDEGTGRVSVNDKPIHDWTSHKRSMLEYFAVNLNWNPEAELEKKQGTFAEALSAIQSQRNYTNDVIS